MMGRREFGMAGASALALAALGKPGFAQEKQKEHADHKKDGKHKGLEHREHDKAFQDCAEACSECQRACDMCATHCAHLLHAGKQEHLKTLMTCQDCADVCAAASQITARGGPFAVLICKACADACAKCAEQCEKFPDDKHMQECAEECRDCEKACRKMVEHIGHGDQ